MPRISFFYGIAVFMHRNEGKHARPHLHARYSGEAASFDLEGELIAGSLPPRALSLVVQWARLTRFPSIPAVEQLVDITAVEVVGDYRLRLSFEDGTVGEVGFTAREWRGVFEPLSDPAYFAQVRVDPGAGTIAWPNGADMAPEPLYEEARGNIVAPASDTL